MPAIIKQSSNVDQYSNDQTSESVLSLCTPKSRRRVSFSCSARTLRTLHLNSYAQNEIEATWLTADEYKGIRQEIVVTLEIIQSGKELDGTKYCRRGLERCKPAVMIEDRRRVAIEGVIDEQELQRHVGVNDKGLLASVYSALSHESKVAARLLGLDDAKNSQQVAPPKKAYQKVREDTSGPKRWCNSAKFRQFSPPVA